DPEHPRLSSRVSELLGPATGDDRIFVPDLGSDRELVEHALGLPADTLPAGGADLFEAILRTRGLTRPVGSFWAARTSGRTLFACGSAAAWDAGRETHYSARGITVVSMPADLFDGKAASPAADDWSRTAAMALRETNGVMLAIGRPSHHKSKLPPRQLLSRL